MNKPLAPTPPMGWNSWNTFGWNINEELIKTAADAFVETGLKDAGYEYIVIDDCWSEKQRDENGRLVKYTLPFGYSDQIVEMAFTYNEDGSATVVFAYE